MRYHAYRRSFWQALDAWTKVITVMSGTAALVSFLAHWAVLSEIFAFAVAGFGGLDVILGFSKRADDHDELYRAFCKLRADIVDNLSPSAADIVSWKRRRLEIEMDEPGVLDLLERRCSGEEAKSRGLELRPLWKLSRWQVVRSQWAIIPSFPHGTET